MATDALGSVLAPFEDKIVAYTGRVVDQDGLDICFPPLHVHHLHISIGEDIHWWETHGDFSKGNDFGGVGCDSARSYRREVPEGYCVVRPSAFSGAPVIWAVVNDVRDGAGSGLGGHSGADPTPSSSDSAAITFYLEVIFELADDGAGDDLKTASTMWFMNPGERVRRYF